MHDRGLIYEGASHRLFGALEAAGDDVDFLLEKIRPLIEATEMASQQAFEEIGRRFNELVGRLPAMDQAVADSGELYHDTVRPMGRLRRAVERARANANIIDGLPRPADVPAMRLAALGTETELVKARRATLDLLLAHRVKKQLEGLRPGQSINFKTDYETDLPSIDERQRLLKAFARRHDYFDDAVFDPPREIIWRKSRNRAWRVASCFLLVALGGVLVGLFAIVGAIDWPDNLHWDDTDDLLTAYALVLGGVLAHLGVENVKQSQANTVPILAIGETVDWIHLRWAGLAKTYFFVVVTVLGLRSAGTDVSGEEALVFFFGGYSVDSVAGAFLTRFGTAANKGVAGVNATAAGPTG